MHVELVKTTTADGVRLDGALHESAHPGAASLAICLHGVGSNFYSSALFEALVAPLAERGVATLRVNTRGHDNVTAGRRWLGAAFEIVDDCRLDVAAWLAWAAERGYARVLLIGHSLGGIKSLYAAAHDSLPRVVGIAALSPPRLSAARFQASPEKEKYYATLATAEQRVLAGEPQTLFLSRFPFPLYITAEGWIDKYGPRERYNILRFLPRVPLPVLLTYGELELGGAAFRGIVEEIAALENSHSVARRVVTISGADHNYTGQFAEVGGTVCEWLAGLP